MWINIGISIWKSMCSKSTLNFTVHSNHGNKTRKILQFFPSSTPTFHNIYKYSNWWNSIHVICLVRLPRQCSSSYSHSNITLNINKAVKRHQQIRKAKSVRGGICAWPKYICKLFTEVYDSWKYYSNVIKFNLPELSYIRIFFYL